MLLAMPENETMYRVVFLTAWVGAVKTTTLYIIRLKAPLPMYTLYRLACSKTTSVCALTLCRGRTEEEKNKNTCLTCGAYLCLQDAIFVFVSIRARMTIAPDAKCCNIV